MVELDRQRRNKRKKRRRRKKNGQQKRPILWESRFSLGKIIRTSYIVHDTYVLLVRWFLCSISYACKYRIVNQLRNKYTRAQHSEFIAHHHPSYTHAWWILWRMNIIVQNVDGVIEKYSPNYLGISTPQERYEPRVSACQHTYLHPTLSLQTSSSRVCMIIITRTITDTDTRPIPRKTLYEKSTNKWRQQKPAKKKNRHQPYGKVLSVAENYDRIHYVE